MSVAEVLGYVTGVTVILGTAAKLLISDWHKKSKEIQELKRRQTKAAILDLQHVAKEHTIAIRSHELKLAENTTHLKYVQERSKTLVSKLELVMNHNEVIQKDIRGAIQGVIKSEVINLTKQLMLVKTKKNGL